MVDFPPPTGTVLPLVPKMPPKPVSVTPETLKVDIANVVAFLKTLEQTAPGRSVEEAVAELEHALQSNLALELLAKAFSGK